MAQEPSQPSPTQPPLRDREILLAVTEPVRERLGRVLEGHKLAFARDCSDVERRLGEREYAMMILGVRFDESRMFEVLRLVRIREPNRRTPVVCVLGERSGLSDVLVEGLDHAVKAMLANAFLNFEHFPDDQRGNDRIRRIVDYLILVDGDMHGSLER
jgi:hypothetical protein